MRSIVAVAVLSTLAIATPLAKRSNTPLAPLSEEGDRIDDSYIVVFKKDVNVDQMAFHLGGVEESHGLDVSTLFDLPSIFPQGSQGRKEGNTWPMEQQP